MVADSRPGGLEGLGVVVLPTEPLAVGDQVARLRVDILPEAAIHRRRPQTRVRPHARLGHVGVGVHAVRRKLGCGARGVERLSFTSTICAKVEVRRVKHRGRHNARDRTRAEVVGPAQRELWLPLRLHARVSKVLLVLGERVELAAEGPLAGQRARRVERPEVPLDLRIRHAGRHALPHRRSSPEAVVHVGRRELGALRCAPAALRAGADELDLAEPQLVESDSALRYARAQCVLRPNRKHRLVLRLPRCHTAPSVPVACPQAPPSGARETPPRVPHVKGGCTQAGDRHGRSVASDLPSTKAPRAESSLVRGADLLRLATLGVTRSLEQKRASAVLAGKRWGYYPYSFRPSKFPLA
eukprot:scaffold67158_cov60-Phaeocystis_antarctica.AAC.5